LSGNWQLFLPRTYEPSIRTRTAKSDRHQIEVTDAGRVHCFSELFKPSPEKYFLPYIWCGLAFLHYFRGKKIKFFL